MYGKWGLPSNAGPLLRIINCTPKRLRNHESEFFIIDMRKMRPREESLRRQSTQIELSRKPLSFFSNPSTNPYCLSGAGLSAEDPKMIKSLLFGEAAFEASHYTECGMYCRTVLGGKGNRVLFENSFIHVFIGHEPSWYLLLARHCARHRAHDFDTCGPFPHS